MVQFEDEAEDGRQNSDNAWLAWIRRIFEWQETE